MKRRRAAPIAASAFAMVALAAALLAPLYSCNFMMPSANYPVMRQEKELIFLESYSIPTYSDIRDLRFGFGALDGSSSLSGAGSPIAYLSLTNRDWGEGQIVYLAPGVFKLLDRGVVGFDEKRISIDNGAGFLTEDGGNLVRIDRLASAIQSTPLGNTLADIETAAATGPLRGFAGNIFAAAPYRAFFDNGTDLFTRSTNALPNTAALALFVGGRNAIASSFTELTDAAYPGSVFWNTGGYDVRRSGFSATGAFSWIEAVRFDTVRNIEEVKLASLRDNGTLRVSSLEPAGSAGDYVLAWKKREAPGFALSVLNLDLNEVHGFSVYGQDVSYLGQALVALPSGMVQSAIFATLGTARNYDEGGGEVTIALYAYPVSLLDGSAP